MWSFRSFSQSVVASFIVTTLVVAAITVADAQVRSSTNYQLQSDSINIGGGYSSSTNYQQESTIGEIATGRSTSTSYSLRAGYQQMQQIFISIAVSNNVSLTPNIGGLSGGTSNGSTTVTVVTDNGAGYQLSIEAENGPAMKRIEGSETIADYAPAGAAPDYTFTTAAGDAHLGYSPEGVDTAARFLNLGTTCATGSANDSLACWDGLSTTAQTIAQGTGGNQPDGATTTVHFRVGVGGTAGVIAGEYVATSTVTALPL